MATSAEVGRIVLGVLYILATFGLAIFQIITLILSQRSNVFSQYYKMKTRTPYILLVVCTICSVIEEIFVAWGGVRYTKDGLEEFGTRFVFCLFAWSEMAFYVLISATLFTACFNALNVDDGMESSRSRIIRIVMAVQLVIMTVYGVIVECVHTIILFFSYKTVYDHGYPIAMDVLHSFFVIMFILSLVTVVVLLILSASIWKSEIFGDEHRPTYDALIGLTVIFSLLVLFLVLMDIGRPHASPAGYRLFWQIVRKLGTLLALATAGVALMIQYISQKSSQESYNTVDDSAHDATVTL